ncbi:MAG: LapA family protein [Pseudomonadota bacterium]
MTPKRVVFLVILFLFALFIIQNAQVVEVRFLFWKAQASRALVLLGTFILGLVAGWLTVRLRKKDQGEPTKENLHEIKEHGASFD